MNIVRCARCDAKLRSAGRGAPAEECPADGSVFRGGWSYGSGLYDTAHPMSPVSHIEIVLCDECIKKLRVHKSRLRVIKKPVPVGDAK